MTLATSYSLKTGSFRAYFDSIHSAAVPERFSASFMADLGYDQTNDRQFLGVLKDLGFITDDGKPTDRYINFLDKSESDSVLAEGIKDAFSDLFAVNKKAYEIDLESLKGKLKVLYKGKKSDLTVERIAKTFIALCELADFSQVKASKDDKNSSVVEHEESAKSEQKNPQVKEPAAAPEGRVNSLSIQGLQYHINIVLPESRDSSVYDAIFSSLRRHLG